MASRTSQLPLTGHHHRRVPGKWRWLVSGRGVDDPRWIVAGDFNGDGRTDLAAANYGGNSVSIFLGNGDGTFGKAVTYSSGPSGTNQIGRAHV